MHHRRRTLRVTFNCVILAFTFTLCWTPLVTVTLLHQLTDLDIDFVHDFTLIPALLTCVLNPAINGLMMKDAVSSLKQVHFTLMNPKLLYTSKVKLTELCIVAPLWHARKVSSWVRLIVSRFGSPIPVFAGSTNVTKFPIPASRPAFFSHEADRLWYNWNTVLRGVAQFTHSTVKSKQYKC